MTIEERMRAVEMKQGELERECFRVSKNTHDIRAGMEQIVNSVYLIREDIARKTGYLIGFAACLEAVGKVIDHLWK